MQKLLILLSMLALAGFGVGCGDDDSSSGTDAGPMTGEDGGPVEDEDAGPVEDEDAGPVEDVDAGPEADAGPVEDGFAFRDDAPGDYTRVDRMGAPAVSTALVTSDNKNDYNDGDPTDDVSGDAPGRWAGEFIGVLDGLHAAGDPMTINEQLEAAGLVPCEDGTECATQELGGEGGPPVYSFVIPDVLTIDTGGDRAFPNGRGLGDQALDIVLALVLLDVENEDQVGAFAGIPLNPDENPEGFRDEFPYVQVPNE